MLNVGIAADHGGYELKEQLLARLRSDGYSVVDYGAYCLDNDDDYPDFIIPLARAVRKKEVDRGIAVCGSGVGACVVANKIPGVRAALIHDIFSAHQGVEDDDTNMVCLGGRVVGFAYAWELIRAFLNAQFSGAERHRRRLDKMAVLEHEKDTVMKTNPLLRLQEMGQSIWLDYIRRKMLISGELKKLIKEDGLRGVTSNPAIFEKAIVESDDYLGTIRSLAADGKTAAEIYQIIAIEDIRNAADDFLEVFDSTDGRDGFVSLEVSPELARDTEGTIVEARKLWSALDRANVFIKVPGTREGLPAIRQLISEGINVNVTLLFDLDRYREVTEAFIRGLEQRAAAGGRIDIVRSVASFFLSRIDLMVDPLLEDLIKQGGNTAETAGRLHGETAIASAKIAYQIYKEVFSSERFAALSRKGAQAQRVLWASTSTKNPSYSDVKYVEALIGPHTINTVPVETLNAYRDHGNPEPRLERDVENAREVMRLPAEVGIDMKKITARLEEEGIEKFRQPFHSLMSALDEKRLQTASHHAGSKSTSEMTPRGSDLT